MRSLLASTVLVICALLTAATPVLAAAPDTTITSGPSGPWNSRAATFTFVSSRSNSKFKCKIDAKSWVLCTTPKTYTNLGNGQHTFKVKAKNGTAVDKTPATRTFTVDVTAPSVSITSNPTDPAGPGAAFQFTVSDGNIACKLDTGAFGVCASSTTQSYSNLSTGSHTFTVHATDAAGNVGSDSFTWMVDATGPTVTFDSVPPAAWPVNYYDFTWHANETSSYECKLNSAAYVPCTSPWTVGNATYAASNTVSVRGTDGFGNVGPASTVSWTPNAGLVLHYPFEQGSLANTSLLSQRPAYSAGGSGPSPVVGGWAGTALTLAGPSSTLVTFPGTARALSSGPYSFGQSPAISMWVRPRDHDDLAAVLFSNTDAPVGDYGEGPSHGLLLYISGGNTSTTAILTLDLWSIYEGPDPDTNHTSIPLDKWTHVAVQSYGQGHGVALFINGNFAFGIEPPDAYGFEPGSGDLRIGPGTNVDIDDLRIYNTTLAQSALCTIIARGYWNGSQCSQVGPAAELDFEHGPTLTQDGFMSLSVAPPGPSWDTWGGPTGDGFRLLSAANPLALTGYSSQAAVPGHSVAMWVAGQSAPGTFFDLTKSAAGCTPCGIKITGTDTDSNGQVDRLVVYASTGTSGATNTFTSAALDYNLHSIVVAEQRSGNGAATTGLRIYIDGALKATLDMSSGTAGDLFAPGSNTITVATQAGTLMDEVELWPMDLSADPEVLCENGFDGEWDPANGSCVLTTF